MALSYQTGHRFLKDIRKSEKALGGGGGRLSAPNLNQCLQQALAWLHGGNLKSKKTVSSLLLDLGRWGVEVILLSFPAAQTKLTG